MKILNTFSMNSVKNMLKECLTSNLIQCVLKELLTEKHRWGPVEVCDKFCAGTKLYVQHRYKIFGLVE